MDKAKQQIGSYIEDNKTIFTDVSDEIWAHPELSLKEFYATQVYVKALRKLGFTVTENVGGMETAFMGSYGHGRPVIGILGEYDALSDMSQEKACPEKKSITPNGAGHGCGHNMLGAGALAGAAAVKDYLERTGREGTVIFFGCPGEEGGAGKAFMARDNAWAALDAALTWHPGTENEVVSGTNNSSIQVLYEFEGISAHAAGDPYNGRSALDGVELMNIGVQFLREHMTDDCRVHYAIVDGGGISPNVVQSHAGVLYMVRANKVRDSLKLLKRVDKIAEGAALMTETTFKRTFIDGTAELVPNFVLEDALYENFKEAGVCRYTEKEWEFAARLKETCPVEEAPGYGAAVSDEVRELAREKSENGKRAINDFLLPPVHTTAFYPGSSDVGDVSWQTPTAQIRVSVFSPGAPGHSWQNVSMGGSSIGHKGLLKAGEVIAMTAVDLFEQPELLQRAREEFSRRTASGYVCPIEEGARPIAL